jgi:hypothetical protein
VSRHKSRPEKDSGAWGLKLSDYCEAFATRALDLIQQKEEEASTLEKLWLIHSKQNKIRFFS